MIKTALSATLFLMLFLGTTASAQAGTHVSVGVAIGIGPGVPYGYCCYPGYARLYYPDYYAYPVVRPNYRHFYPSYGLSGHHKLYRMREVRRRFRDEGHEGHRGRRAPENRRLRSNPGRY